VIAARLALAGTAPGRTDDPAAASQVIADSSIGSATDYLLEEIALADSLEIVGILPWQCASLLMEISARHVHANRETVRASNVRYFTPARDRVAVYRHSEVLGPLVQRWFAGITGFRNWLLPRRAGEGSSENLIFEFPDLFLDCLVHIVKAGQSKVVAMTRLPSAGSLDDQREVNESPLIITQLPQYQADQVRAHLRILSVTAKPLVSREVICQADGSGEGRAEGDEFVPVMSALQRNDHSRPARAVIPVSVVVMLAPTAQGRALLLKRRTKWNSREDFDTLSLLSERVLEEDFTAALAPPLNGNDTKALDELWLRIGRPSPFLVPEDSFRHAAQREMFTSCGLDIAANRLELRGTCFLDREDSDEHIGFYVFTLDLQRSAGPDEVGHALAWNTDLELVPVAELYARSNLPRLNRLLKRRDGWLRRCVLVEGTVG
jgi:hypothetical protein